MRRPVPAGPKCGRVGARLLDVRFSTEGSVVMGRKLLAAVVGFGSIAVMATTTLLLAQGGAAQKPQIHIYWGKTGWLNWTCSKGDIKLILDDKDLGKIKEKECVKLAVDPGNHSLQGIKQAMVKRRDLLFEADPGKKIYIKGNCTEDGIFQWNLQTTDQAKDWAGECKAADEKEEKK
jgi:hypothetical protein